MRKFYNLALLLFMKLALGIVLFLIVSIVGFVFIKGIPHITWHLVSSKPSYLTETIGILPDILNTIYLTLASICIVLPIASGAAIYLNEYAKNKTVVEVITYAFETLGGIPSIIYGLVGMLVFCQFMRLGTSLLAGALTMVIMTLPTIMRTMQESLKSVAPGIREGAFALGTPKWKVIFTVVLPSCIDGLVTGSILAIARILAESAALLFTAGFAHSVNGFFDSLYQSGSTLTVALYVYAKEQGEFGIALAIAAILMVVTVILNLSAQFLGQYLKRRSNG